MSFGRSRAVGGTAGAQGYQGNQGTPGSTGSQGTQGNQGVAGSQGSQGNQGFQGAGGTPPFSDAVAILANNLTPTKLLRFELAGLPVGTTIITPAAVDITLPGINIANTWAATQTFSVPLVIPAGVVGAPALAFAGDLDTGIYRRGGGEMSFVSDGVEQFFTSADGVVVTSLLLWPNESRIGSPDEGEFLLAGGTTFDFSWLYLGGATSAFPALKRNGTSVEFKLGDDSAFAAIKALGITLTNGAGLNKVLTSDASGVATWQTPSGGGSGPPFSDATAILEDDATGTKLLRFDLTGLSATTRVITPPDSDITLAGQNFANVFSVAQTINAGTVTVSTPVLNLAQTWNAGGVTFTGLKLDITSTSSAAASMLLDLQVGGSSKLSISKAGLIAAPNGSASGTAYGFSSNGNSGMWWNGGTLFFSVLGSNILQVGPNFVIISSDTTAFALGTAADVVLYRETAGVLGLRNGTGSQIFRIYNTSDAGLANYERGLIGWSSNILTIGTEKLGTGASRDIQIVRNGTVAMAIGSDSLVTLAGDPTDDMHAATKQYVDGMGSGGSGDYSLGTNVRIKDGNLQILNAETGKWNSLTNTGAETAETTGYGDAEV